MLEIKGEAMRFYHACAGLLSVAMFVPPAGAAPDPLCTALEVAARASNIGFRTLRGKNLLSDDSTITKWACTGIVAEGCEVGESKVLNPHFPGLIWIEWDVETNVAGLPALARSLVNCIKPMRAQLGEKPEPALTVREIAEALKSGFFSEPVNLPGTRLHAWVFVHSREVGNRPSDRVVTIYVGQADRM